MVEPIKLVPLEERGRLLEEAGYNLFNLRSEDVYIDLLTDSGTTAMSSAQWGALLQGDEAYAGSASYERLRDSVRDRLGYEFLVIAHQGRAAEHLLMRALVEPGQRVLGNMHFDTTEGHILLRGAEPVNLLSAIGYDTQAQHPFKGDIDLERLESELRECASGQVPFVLLTITCNNNGGQPVSMSNIKETARLAHRHGVPLFFDAARFAENAYFIKMRDPAYRDTPIPDIVREMFSYGDGCTMSAKKDGLVNMGGFVAVRDEDTYRRLTAWQIPFEGFTTYGGLAGRDMEALAQGLKEVVDERYLENRIGQVAYLAARLRREGVPAIEPPGGHGVYIDARKMLPHISQGQFPAQTLAVELYLEGGIRGVELGACAFGRTDPDTGEAIWPELELVRLAIPRRVYTDRHMDYVARALVAINERKTQMRGLRLIYEAPVLRHFTARFERL